MSNNKKSKTAEKTAEKKKMSIDTPPSSENKAEKQTISENVVKDSSKAVKETTDKKNQKDKETTTATNKPAVKTPVVDKTANSVENNKPVKKQNNKSTNKFMYFLMLLVIFVVLSAAYYFWLHVEKQNKFIEQQARIVNTLQSEVKTISESVDNEAQLNAAHSLQLQQHSEKISQTEAISQKAIEIVKRSRREWALSEIDYLLRMAHRRLEVARDVGGAIAALKGADSRIQELSDLNLFKIRKQLTKDIAGLNAIHQADVNGISLSIDGMIVYLSELPFKSVKEEIKVQLGDEKVAEESKSTEEQSFVDSVLETVKKIGDIKVHQRSIQAASSLEQQNEIEQLLRTYLLSARLAALRFNQMQFLREIQLASEILRLHYDAKDNRVIQLQKTLSDFSALQLSPDLPELTTAWSMLQNIINKTSEKKEIIKNKEQKVNNKEENIKELPVISVELIEDKPQEKEK